MNDYRAEALPPELWPGSQERWGVLAPNGEWLRSAPDDKVYWFVNAPRAQAYADQCNGEVSRRVAAASDRQA
jgi:hypothetical protein